MSELRFTTAAVDEFARLSRDVNPLHTDDTYASRTPFGERVVHGALGCLAALGRAGSGTVWARDIVLRFPRPLLIGRAYAVEIDPPADGSRRRLRLVAGGSAKLVTDAAIEEAPAPPVSAAETFQSREVPAALGVADLTGVTRAGRYAIDDPRLDHAPALRELGLSRIAPLDVAALCWASYLVGMEIPGRQALFHGLRIQFEPAAERAIGRAAFDYEARVKRVERTNTLVQIDATLSEQGEPLATVSLQSFVRPAPVDYHLDQVRTVLGAETPLAGKVCLVTGSSRGLGALLAMGCALRGADVILHHRRNGAAAERIQRQIQDALGRRCEIVGGDVAQPGTWDQLARVVREQFGRLDVLIHSAYPAIQPLELAELDDEIVDAHIHAPLDSALLAHSRMLGFLREARGCMVNISSAYVTSPPAGMVHYAMVKSAVESLAQGLARTEPSVRFVTVRPPRILTDQTNVGFDLAPASSPLGVVRAVIDALEDGSVTGHVLLDRFPP